jgi:hypothetical protein
VQQLMAVNPDVVFEDIDFASTVGINAEMKAANYKGILYSPGVTYALTVLQSQPNVAAALDGEYDDVEFAVQEQADNPAVQQINNDLQAPDAPSEMRTTLAEWPRCAFTQAGTSVVVTSRGSLLTALKKTFRSHAVAAACWTEHVHTPVPGTLDERMTARDLPAPGAHDAWLPTVQGDPASGPVQQPSRLIERAGGSPAYTTVRLSARRGPGASGPFARCVKYAGLGRTIRCEVRRYDEGANRPCDVWRFRTIDA